MNKNKVNYDKHVDTEDFCKSVNFLHLNIFQMTCWYIQEINTGKFFDNKLTKQGDNVFL